MILWAFLYLLAIHWVADFILQTHWQASNKSKNWNALLCHVGSYALALYTASFLLFDWYVATAFALVNGILHFATDAVTSRITSRLYAKGNWHNFFVVIGLDQLIHQAILAGTLWVALLK